MAESKSGIDEKRSSTYTGNMGNKKDNYSSCSNQPLEYGQAADRQHDERIVRDCEAIINEDDFWAIINSIYSDYCYLDAQSAKLIRFNQFLAQENNRHIHPELAEHSQRMNAYLDVFLDFLNRNFIPGVETGDGEKSNVLISQKPGFENESLLIEFQMVSMDMVNAYRSYRKLIVNRLKI